MSADYERLVELVKKAGILGSVNELLDWDQEVIMQPGELTQRSQESGVVSEIAHGIFTCEEVGELLSRLQVAQDLTDEQRALVREVAFDYNREKMVPPQLVRDFAETGSHAQHVWAQARKENDFSKFEPWLDKLVQLSRQKAAAINPQANPYEVLFNEFESGMTLEEAQLYLMKIKAAVVPLVKQITEKKHPKDDFLTAEVPEHIQHELNMEIITKLGYDFSRGRLDTSTHPFTGHHGRITTRYCEGWAIAILSTIHECGHANYEHGLPLEHFGTPLGEARSLSIHESQSRILENQMGRSTAFWMYWFEKAQEKYDSVLKKVKLIDFLRAINEVEPGFIRVNADELTYNLHIILRFQMEQEMISGQLPTSQVPQRWNQLMQELLGITPPTDTEGCLQDIHWSGAAGFGYFPTYVFGSMIAAQLFAAAKRAMPDIDEQFASGEYGQFTKWLHENIHVHGRRYTLHELVERASGKPLSADDYIAYLTEKFTKLYGLN